MIIRHLNLTNFRSYINLDIELPPHIAIFRGDNAQGKSNLLEAVYLLATSRSPRASTEKELINWSAFEDDLPVCRIVAFIEKATGNLTLEIAHGSRVPLSDSAGTAPDAGSKSSKHSQTYKRIKVNGVPRRATDLVGLINVVSFSVHDIDIIDGEPALRRRYLDVTNCQLDSQYMRHLQRYQKVLSQRNRLLRQIAENQATEEELSFWDHELIRTGSYLSVQRYHLVAEIERLAQDIHGDLSGSGDSLTIAYISSIHKDRGKGDSRIEETADLFARSLQAARVKEVAQGVTLVGPHRDDLRFLTNGVDTGIFGSRGQQRTIALSLKLAEASFMLQKTGDHPILLLDDVLSELDSRRRDHLLQSVARYRQVLMTTTDLDHFEPGFMEQAALFNVEDGSVQPVTG